MKMLQDLNRRVDERGGEPTPLPNLSVGNNALGVTRSIVASWLCVAACKNRIQLFSGFVGESRRERVVEEAHPHAHSCSIVPGIWSSCSGETPSELRAAPHNFCGPYRFPPVTPTYGNTHRGIKAPKFLYVPDSWR